MTKKTTNFFRHGVVLHSLQSTETGSALPLVKAVIGGGARAPVANALPVPYRVSTSLRDEFGLTVVCP